MLVPELFIGWGEVLWIKWWLSVTKSYKVPISSGSEHLVFNTSSSLPLLVTWFMGVFGKEKMETKKKGGPITREKNNISSLFTACDSLKL